MGHYPTAAFAVSLATVALLLVVGPTPPAECAVTQGGTFVGVGPCPGIDLGVLTDFPEPLTYRPL